MQRPCRRRIPWARALRAVAIAVALVASVILTIAVTALVLKGLSGGARK